MRPRFFADAPAFRKWLEKNHDKKAELIVGFYKVGSGKKNMTWSESVDQALCFGWIDGVRRSIDDESYQIRFTPRKPGSNWSAVNIGKVKQLKKQGLMRPPGIAAFDHRKEERSAVYAYENEFTELSPAFVKRFRANKKAWTHFQALAPSYRKTSIRWVMSAKQEKTRINRLDQLIAHSESGKNQWKDNKYNKR